jgi:hypothetical protein
MTLTLLATWLAGVGSLVALTMIVSSLKSWARAASGAARAVSATEEYTMDFNTAFSWLQESARNLSGYGYAIECPATTPILSPLRFTPLHPAHPGRLQDDGARQVSWLPALRFRPPSQGPILDGTSQWHLDDHSPVTVAGAATVSHRIPYTLHLGAH